MLKAGKFDLSLVSEGEEPKDWPSASLRRGNQRLAAAIVR